MIPVSLRLPYETLNIIVDQANKRGMTVGTFIRAQLMKTAHNPVNTLAATQKVINDAAEA